MKAEIVTIGVYGFAEEGFFQALREAKVDTFCDIRRRRGVRGSEYAFANSERLQKRLAELGIRYVHRLDLAPSLEIRERQNAADKASKTAKRQRAGLAPEFVEGYKEQHLSGLDAAAFLADMGADAADARVIALFCVERDPAACHRSLLAEHLAGEAGLRVRHILPE